jgi:hypothetical protein
MTRASSPAGDASTKGASLGTLPTERVSSMAGGRWLSPEKRLVWDQEIAGSNPARPTNSLPGRSFELAGAAV